MAKNYDVTSLNMSATVMASRSYPAGFALEGFADDEAVSAAATQIADSTIGIDGKGVSWRIKSPKEITIKLNPTCFAAKALLRIAAAQQAGEENEDITMVVTYPAQGMTYRMTGGVLKTYTPLPASQKRLADLPFVFNFADVVPSEI